LNRQVTGIQKSLFQNFSKGVRGITSLCNRPKGWGAGQNSGRDRETAARRPESSRGPHNRPWLHGTSASDPQSFRQCLSSLPCHSAKDGELLSPFVLHHLLLDRADRLGFGLGVATLPTNLWGYEFHRAGLGGITPLAIAAQRQVSSTRGTNLRHQRRPWAPAQ